MMDYYYRSMMLPLLLCTVVVGIDLKSVPTVWEMLDDHGGCLKDDVCARDFRLVVLHMFRLVVLHMYSVFHVHFIQLVLHF